MIGLEKNQRCDENNRKGEQDLINWHTVSVIIAKAGVKTAIQCVLGDP